MGLNSIREICARVPLAIEDESVAESDVEGRAALLRDLVAYKSHRDKGVSMAARYANETALFYSMPVIA